MRNLRITLAYDGADFSGWQVQPGRVTIQGTLADALARLTGETSLPQGAGRTDRGVHALGQVATWQTASPIPCENLLSALNDALPPGIRALAVEEAAPEFHARGSALAKTYRYRIWRGSICPPFQARYVWHYPYPLDEAEMAQAAAQITGEHDFSSFAATDPERAARLGNREASNLRTIWSSAWERCGDELIYTVRGNGFLHHMVRNLVGLFILAGKQTVRASDIPAIIAARSRAANPGATVPAQGLCMVSVEY